MRGDFSFAGNTTSSSISVNPFRLIPTSPLSKSNLPITISRGAHLCWPSDTCGSCVLKTGVSGTRSRYTRLPDFIRTLLVCQRQSPSCVQGVGNIDSRQHRLAFDGEFNPHIASVQDGIGRDTVLDDSGRQATYGINYGLMSARSRARINRSLSLTGLYKLDIPDTST